ncbi:uncharacterized protein LOC132724672 [Ruditapes philippinarum]|uniref:uncharacterized protein LOC132724672 n=1 Tax=Ruditapes philippinarum TaxID=129788 RepID=UPI00295B5CBE|nr:uncharacterized protein LOC132724672 [Ruditapes philippinarum]
MAQGDDEKFEIKGLIGEGAFGKVFLLEKPSSKEQLALKMCQLAGKHPKEIEQTVQEVKLLASLKHEYIVQYVEAAFEDGKLMIITEYCPNGDLQEYLRDHAGTAMEENRLIEWIRQITSALEYLHGLPNPVIHRDLKTANIFFDGKWNTKLGDFGIARILQTATDLAMTQCGTPMYMSPEVFAGIPYSDKTDIYSLGIMMYEMAHMDKEAILPQMILFKIVHQTLPTMPTNYSSDVTDLLTSMIKKDPRDRPSAKQILSHKMFKSPKKVLQIPPKRKHSLSDVDDEDKQDDGMKTLLGTLTQLHMHDGRVTRGGGAANMLGNRGDDGTCLAKDNDEFESNPVMQFVKRTLADMGHDQIEIQGRSMLERQLEMLKIYCLHCLDNNTGLFERACKALDTYHSEEEIEEVLIRILGHERYGLCGLQLLHYKNFKFNLRS